MSEQKPEDYNPNSINAVLSRIETKVNDHNDKLERIEQKVDEGNTQLWKAHSNLKTKVAGIGAIMGLITTGIAEFIIRIFHSDPK